MPRKRNEENRGLPARWAQKHGAFYYIPRPRERHQWDGKSWFRLGDNLADAYRPRLCRADADGSGLPDLRHPASVAGMGGREPAHASGVVGVVQHQDRRHPAVTNHPANMASTAVSNVLPAPFASCRYRRR